jgi:hypothetical protein
VRVGSGAHPSIGIGATRPRAVLFRKSAVLKRVRKSIPLGAPALPLCPGPRSGPYQARESCPPRASSLLIARVLPSFSRTKERPGGFMGALLGSCYLNSVSCRHRQSVLQTSSSARGVQYLRLMPLGQWLRTLAARCPLRPANGRRAFPHFFLSLDQIFFIALWTARTGWATRHSLSAPHYALLLFPGDFKSRLLFFSFAGWHLTIFVDFTPEPYPKTLSNYISIINASSPLPIYHLLLARDNLAVSFLSTLDLPFFFPSLYHYETSLVYAN